MRRDIHLRATFSVHLPLGPVEQIPVAQLWFAFKYNITVLLSDDDN